ncbi:MAG TPA: hypothetical protein VJ739_08810 [Gemmataceae bacterium]|nr:hypothetical protein [Gemmataceae bacterium]
MARGFPVGENESPRPLDRVFGTFNFYDNVNPRANTQSGFLSQANVYVERVGFEKTFLDGNASVGMRLPVNTFQAQTSPGFEGIGGTSTAVGDLNILFKYAVVNDRASGNLVSVGLMVTAPTGPDNFAGFTFPGLQVHAFHNTLLQPFVGYIWYLTDNLYLQGISSVATPTDTNDTTVMFNGLGLSDWLYRSDDCRMISAIIPTAEVHVNTPLNHRHDMIADSVDLTQGVSLELYQRAWFTCGVSENVTGPKTFDVEAIAQLNVLF